MGETNAQDPDGWKRPWRLWGVGWVVGLRLNRTEGVQACPPPQSQRVGDLTWKPSRLPRPKWAGQTPSAPPLGPLLPASPDLPGLPPMPPGPMRPGWGFGGGTPAWELSRPPARVGQVIALCSSPALPGESLTPASPDLPGLRGANPV